MQGRPLPSSCCLSFPSIAPVRLPPQHPPCALRHLPSPPRPCRHAAGDSNAERLETLTESIQTLLQGAYLPGQLQALLEESYRDPAGLMPQDSDRGGAPDLARGNTRAAGAAGAAAAGRGRGRAGSNGASGGASGAQRPGRRGSSGRPSYRYTPLAVAALAELLRRTDTHLATSLQPRLRDLSTQLVASAANNESRHSQQTTIRTLAAQLHASAALLAEMSRVATAVALAVNGNVLPLSDNTAAALQPDGEALRSGWCVCVGVCVVCWTH